MRRDHIAEVLAAEEFDTPLPITKRKFKIRPEDSLQVKCIRYLRGLKDVRFLVSQGERTAANSSPQRRDRLKALGVLGNKGCVELTVLDARHSPPRAWFIELKAPKGPTKTEQLEWQDWLERKGFLYGLVRSVEDLIALLG